MANFYCNALPRWWLFGGVGFASGTYPMEWAKVYLQRQSNYAQLKTIIGKVYHQKGTLACFLGLSSARELLHLANNTQLPLVMGRNYQNVFKGSNCNSSISSLYRIALPMFRSSVIYTIGSVRNHLPLNATSSPQMSYMFKQQLNMVKTLYNINPPQRNEFKSVFGVILKMAKHGPLTLYKEFVPSLLRNKSNPLITLMLYRQMLMRLGSMSQSEKENASNDDTGKA